MSAALRYDFSNYEKQILPNETLKAYCVGTCLQGVQALTQ
jgi:hypothetical protein